MRLSSLERVEGRLASGRARVRSSDPCPHRPISPWLNMKNCPPPTYSSPCVAKIAFLWRGREGGRDARGGGQGRCVYRTVGSNRRTHLLKSSCPSTTSCTRASTTMPATCGVARARASVSEVMPVTDGYGARSSVCSLTLYSGCEDCGGEWSFRSSRVERCHEVPHLASVVEKAVGRGERRVSTAA